MQRVITFWNENDIIVRILIVTSVYMVTVILERSYLFFCFYRDLKRVKLLNSIEETNELKNGSLIRSFFDHIKSHTKTERGVRDNLISIKLDILDKELMQYVSSLGLIASIAPMLGLIGTFVGVMKVFEGVSAYGLSDPNIVAAGIKEALVTTIAGLAVAIPAMISYKTFEHTAMKLEIILEERLFLFLKDEV